MRETKTISSDQSSEASTTADIRFSKHARLRLEKRGLRLSGAMQRQLIGAINSLEHKGGRSSLILFEQLAMLVSVTTRTVITVIGREQLEENVFTAIDSVIFVSPWTR